MNESIRQIMKQMFEQIRKPMCKLRKQAET